MLLEGLASLGLAFAGLGWFYALALTRAAGREAPAPTEFTGCISIATARAATHG